MKNKKRYLLSMILIFGVVSAGIGSYIYADYVKSRNEMGEL